MLDGPLNYRDGRNGALPISGGVEELPRCGLTLDVGLVNNMPDAVLRRTERQFTALLREAAGGQYIVRLHLLAIPQVVRGEAAAAEIAERYHDIADVARLNLDALIVTGCEPRERRLENEPFWPALTELADWAECNVGSVIWSCLAAHAAVRHLDGVERRPIGMKRFGVFHCDVEAAHPLTSGLAATIKVPHSRYNELAEEDLLCAGYSLLTRSAAAGIDTFAKQRRDSLFVFFQGHPEYDAMSLWHEYRRDVARFLTGEREGYPPPPANYLNLDDARKCQSFETRATALRRPDLVPTIPTIDEQMYRAPSWRGHAVSIYRNWLQQLAERQTSRASAQLMAEIR